MNRAKGGLQQNKKKTLLAKMGPNAEMADIRTVMVGKDFQLKRMYKIDGNNPRLLTSQNAQKWPTMPNSMSLTQAAEPSFRFFLRNSANSCKILQNITRCCKLVFFCIVTCIVVQVIARTLFWLHE